MECILPTVPSSMPLTPESPPCFELLQNAAHDKGVKYEMKMAALLKLRARRWFMDFKIYRNVKATHPFDDVVLQLSKGGVTYLVVLQLKLGKGQGDERGRVDLQAFHPKRDHSKKQETGDYNLRRYLSSCERIHEKKGDENFLPGLSCDNVWYILYTNKKVDHPADANFPLEDFFSSNEERGSFSFNETDEDVWNQMNGDEREKLYKEQFLPQLRIFSSQAHVDELDELILQEMDAVFEIPLHKDIKKQILDNFYKEMDAWVNEPKGRCLWECSRLLEKAVAADLRRRAQEATGSGALIFAEEHCQQLKEILLTCHNIHLLVDGVPPGLRAAKLLQVLKTEGSTFHNRWVYVNDKILEVFHPSVIKAACTDSAVLVLDIATSRNRNIMMKIVLQVTGCRAVELTDKSSEKNSILVSAESLLDVWTLEHLTTTSQESLLHKKLDFQGHGVLLKDLESAWPHLRSQVDGAFLSALLLQDPPPRLGASLSANGECENYIERTLNHENLLCNNAVFKLLKSMGPDERLALSGFSQEWTKKLQLIFQEQQESDQQLKLKQDEQTESSLQWHISIPQVGGTLIFQLDSEYHANAHWNNNRWKVLSYEDENKVAGEDVIKFETLCHNNPKMTIHWLERVKGKVIWRNTKQFDGPEGTYEKSVLVDNNRGVPGIVVKFIQKEGERSAICKLVEASGTHCPQPPMPICIHRGNGNKGGVLAEVASWEQKANLLLGEPGMGKTMFLRGMAGKVKKQRPSHWVLMVEVLRHSDILEQMPPAQEVCMAHVLKLLSAAVEMGATETSGTLLMHDAASLFLHDALAESGAVCVFVDGVDEVCPQHQDKILTCLRLLLESKIQTLWVASRKEVESHLCSVIHSTPLNLTPLSPEEQEKYLVRYWTAFSEQQSNPSQNNIPALAHKVVEMFALQLPHNTPKEKSLLAIPLNLHMTAEVLADEISEYCVLRTTNFNILQLYKRFVEKNQERHRKQYRLEDAITKNTNVAQIMDESFNDIHQNYAMLILSKTTNALTGAEYFESICKKKEHYLSREKTGLLWLNDNKSPEFSHSTVVDYFAAKWMFENQENLQAKEFLRSLIIGRNKPIVIMYFNLMLVENQELLEQILLDPRLEAEDLLATESIDSDQGGRTALHLAATCGRGNLISTLVTRLKEAGCDPHQQDKLLGWTPLQYADANLHMKVAEQLMEAGADSSHLENIVHAAGAGPLILVAAVNDNLIQVIKTVLSRGVRKDLLRPFRQEMGVLKYCTDYGDTLLHIAADRGYYELVQYLLHYIDSFDSYNHLHVTPLLMAINGGHLSVAKLLLSKGADEKKTHGLGTTALHSCAFSGNIELFDLLLSKQTIDINTKDHQDNTPLFAALVGRGRHLKMVQFLLSKGASWERISTQGASALHVAASVGDMAMTKFLLSKIQKINVLDDNNATPLYFSLTANQTEVTKFLINSHARVKDIRGKGVTALHVAARMGNLEIVKLVLPSCKKFINELYENHTPLTYAILNENKEMIKVLVSKGANLQKATGVRTSALHTASFVGNVKLMDMFLTQYNIDVNVRGSYDDTPLSFAIEKGHKDAVELLIRKGAYLHQINKDGVSALHAASYFGHLDLVHMFLRADKTDVNERDHCNRTPLCFAIMNKQRNVIELLIQNGADLHKIVTGGLSALHVASSCGHTDIVKMLLSKGGVDSNEEDDGGKTPLCYAIQKEHTDIIELLIDKGANICNVAKEGASALHVAAFYSHIDLVTTLLTKKKLNANQRDTHSRTPLCYAIEKERVKLVVKEGAHNYNIDGEESSTSHSEPVNLFNEVLSNTNVYKTYQFKKTPTYHATDKKHMDVIEILIKKGANLYDIDGRQTSVLHKASFHGYIDIIDRLLTLDNININARDDQNWTPLSYAVQNNHRDVIELLIKNGANLHKISHVGQSALHIASYFGHTDLVGMLLSLGSVDVNERDENETTPLTCAIEKRQKNVVELLIKEGAELHNITKGGASALHCASFFGHRCFVKMLLTQKTVDINETDNLNRTSVCYAIQKGQKNVTELLIEENANLLVIDGVISALHYASWYDQIDIVKMLLVQGKMEVNERDMYNRTPLWYAIERRHKNITELLIEKGANIHRIAEGGVSIVHVASFFGDIELVKTLLTSCDIKVNERDDQNRTPLVYARQNGHNNVIDFLIENGADLQEVENEASILHIASFQNHIECVQTEHFQRCSSRQDSNERESRLVGILGNTKIMES